MKLRGALFGCGMISEFHLRGWNRIPEVEIVALGNRTVEKAAQRRQQFAPEARVYGDLAAMLEHEQLDFIDILTTPVLHREHCLLAKQAGLHIICQKPLCSSLEDGLALAAEVRDYPKLFAVHENHRYRPWFQMVREHFRQGFFGVPRLLRLGQLDAREPPEAYKNAVEEGVLLEYGSHLVDMMCCLLGEPERIYARLHHLNPKVRGESLVHVVYEYPETTAVIEVGWKSGAVQQGCALLLGEEGEAYYEGTMARGQSARLRLTRGHEVVRDEPRNPYEEYVESFYLLERECVDAMLAGSPVTQTAAEYLKSLTATFAAYESACRGAPVDLAEFRSSSAK
jgi:predicted dehydrogenase